MPRHECSGGNPAIHPNPVARIRRSLWLAGLWLALGTTAGGAMAAGPVPPEPGNALVSTAEGIFVVDPESGDRRLLSGHGAPGPGEEELVGEGPALYPDRLEIDPGAGVAYGLVQYGLLRIDLESGDREVVSAPEGFRDAYGNRFGPRGTGPETDLFADRRESTRDLALDLANRRALLLDMFGGLWAIDLDSGDRSRLLEDPVPEVRSGFAKVEMAPGRNALLVFDGSLRAVSPESGAVTLLHDGGIGDAGPKSLNWLGCPDLDYDPKGDRAFLLCSSVMTPVSLHGLSYDISANFVVAIDPVASAKAMISGPDRGEGLAFPDPEVADPGDSNIALDRAGRRVLILPAVIGCNGSPLVAVDLAGGDRRVVSFRGQCREEAPELPQKGSGPRLVSGKVTVIPAE